MEQFVFYGGYRIQFRFSDPALAVGAKARNEYYRNLIEKGILPSNVSYSKNGQKTEKLIFPGALITLKSSILRFEIDFESSVTFNANFSIAF